MLELMLMPTLLGLEVRGSIVRVPFQASFLNNKALLAAEPQPLRAVDSRFRAGPNGNYTGLLRIHVALYRLTNTPRARLESTRIPLVSDVNNITRAVHQPTRHVSTVFTGVVLPGPFRYIMSSWKPPRVRGRNTPLGSS